MAYLSTIVRCTHRYQGLNWAVYDIQFRQKVNKVSRLGSHFWGASGQVPNIPQAWQPAIYMPQPWQSHYDRHPFRYSPMRHPANHNPMGAEDSSVPISGLMHLFRTILFFRSPLQFMSAQHIPGIYNTWADDISRNKHTKFLHACPDMPINIPEFLIALQVDWTSQLWQERFSSFRA